MYPFLKNYMESDTYPEARLLGSVEGFDIETGGHVFQLFFSIHRG